jgi:hypothetical protein
MNSDFSQFDSKGTEAKGMQRALTALAETFSETPELERFNLVSLYRVTAEMQNQHEFDQVKPLLRDWSIGFESTRRDLTPA